MTDDSNRIGALDFLRGFAVMGLLLANLVAIGLPSEAQLSPFAIGTKGPLDFAAWTFNFLLVDGKFRALFAMMLGASMLLVMESAELDGRDGLKAHRRRMLWLAVFGLVQHLLLWSGDLLLPLAVAGLIAASLARFDTFGLVKWALGLLALQWAIDLIAVLPPFAFIAHWPSFEAMLGGAGSHAVASAGYAALLIARLRAFGWDMLGMALFTLPETLAFMVLGMAMLKGGFLSAQWSEAQYRATWRRAYLVGLVPMAGLAAWMLIGRSPFAAEAAGFGWSVPLRLPLAVAHAALAMGIAIRWPDNMLVSGVRAVGRLALSNYLLSTLVATTLFYGYGAGLFARLDRAALFGAAIVGWAVMIGWSVLWRRQGRRGPAEWLWRRLSHGKS